MQAYQRHQANGMSRENPLQQRKRLQKHPRNPQVHKSVCNCDIEFIMTILGFWKE